MNSTAQFSRCQVESSSRKYAQQQRDGWSSVTDYKKNALSYIRAQNDTT